MVRIVNLGDEVVFSATNEDTVLIDEAHASVPGRSMNAVRRGQTGHFESTGSCSVRRQLVVPLSVLVLAGLSVFANISIRKQLQECEDHVCEEENGRQDQRGGSAPVLRWYVPREKDQVDLLKAIRFGIEGGRIFPFRIVGLELRTRHAEQATRTRRISLSTSRIWSEP
jgi:hypothetical protein